MKIIAGLLPMLMNMVIGVVLLITPLRLATAGAGAVAVAATLVTWSLVYALTIGALGRILNEQNAARLVMGSGILVALTAVGLIYFDGLYLQFFWIVLTGVGSGFFAGPVQVFMKRLENNAASGVARATAMYTFSWSCGFASGPFAVMLLWGLWAPQDGWKYCYWLTALVGILISLITFILDHRSGKLAAQPAAGSAEESSVDYSGQPDLVWLGWIVLLGGVISSTILRANFPYKAAVMQWDTARTSWVMALIFYTQGFTALALWKSRYWMYRQKPILGASLLGLAGLLLFAGGERLLPLCVAAVCYGIYSGTFYYYLVFHSLVHPSKSAGYVVVNEVLVGAVGVLAPLLGGLLASGGSRDWPFYLAAAVVLAASGILYGLMKQYLKAGKFANARLK